MPRAELLRTRQGNILMPKVILTLDLQIQEAQRELETRERLYPRWINAGTLQEHVAEYRLATQRAIVLSLKQLQEMTEKPSLFMQKG